MKELEALRGIDVYLIDQLLKGRMNPESKILDAGCGGGRNIHYLIENGADVIGMDSNEAAIASLRNQYPHINDHFVLYSIEEFSSVHSFDFIICNAVLHFAKNHSHFETMFGNLIEHLSPNGVLFIRMTSNIGLNLEEKSQDGVYNLPDGSVRYLITREKIDELISDYSLSLLEPVKTVKVEELRSMTTLVLRRN